MAILNLKVDRIEDTKSAIKNLFACLKEIELVNEYDVLSQFIARFLKEI